MNLILMLKFGMVDGRLPVANDIEGLFDCRVTKMLVYPTDHKPYLGATEEFTTIPYSDLLV